MKERRTIVMRLRQQQWRFSIALLALFCTLFGLFTPSAVSFAAPLHTQVRAQLIAPQQPRNAPTPFMHRPYYGSRTISSRTVSFVDHDHPWYDNDGTFVRYDGAKWTNVAIGSCTAGVNCYDGHNGYDLNMWYEPVLSTAAGSVIRAGWYNPLNHNSSLGLWVAIDHGNGYVTAYGHLSAITVAVGEQVGTQWQIGTSGTTGSSTGPHLHMATYYLPNWQATDPFGWTGNYPDPNVVPDNYLWVDNPGTSNTIPDLSSNGSAVYQNATLVDDGDTGWSSTGSWNTDSASSDIKGDLHWTVTTSGNATATATWHPALSADGYYEVGVYVDATHASSSWVPYTVYSADPNHPGVELSHTVYVDETHIGAFQGPFSQENTGPQWIGLGTYYFKASMNGRVAVSNATGENGVQIAADGVEFVPVNVQNPAPTPSYGFTVINDGTPSYLITASTNTINLTLKNTSNFLWNAGGSDAVQVLYRWLDAYGQPISTSNPIVLPQNVAASTSVTIPVNVQAPSGVGAYTLQWDMMQGATIFSQHGAQVKNDSVQIVSRYSEVFASGALPTTVAAGMIVQTTISIHNTGGITWPATGPAQVTLSYRWVLMSTSNARAPQLVLAGSLGILPSDVAPNGTVTIPLTLQAPIATGDYTFVCDLQQQNAQGGTMSFASQGATPLTESVTITPPLPRHYAVAGEL